MEDCKNKEQKEQACVPFFLHENALMHYSRVNKRMLILFCVWCATEQANCHTKCQYGRGYTS